MQRKYIREEPEKAGIRGELYSGFKFWVKEKYPSDISEETWISILEERAHSVSIIIMTINLNNN